MIQIFVCPILWRLASCVRLTGARISGVTSHNCCQIAKRRRCHTVLDSKTSTSPSFIPFIIDEDVASGALNPAKQGLLSSVLAAASRALTAHPTLCRSQQGHMPRPHAHTHSVASVAIEGASCASAATTASPPLCSPTSLQRRVNDRHHLQSFCSRQMCERTHLEWVRDRDSLLLGPMLLAAKCWLLKSSEVGNSVRP
jgi:hypothetical protein